MGAYGLLWIAITKDFFQTAMALLAFVFVQGHLLQPQSNGKNFVDAGSDIFLHQKTAKTRSIDCYFSSTSPTRVMASTASSAASALAISGRLVAASI